MPLEYWVDEENNIVIEKWTGSVTETQIIEGILEMNKQPLWKAKRSILIHLSGITDVDISSEGIRKFTLYFQERQEKTDNGKVALVSENDVMYGYARMFYSMMDSLPVKSDVMVFRDLAEAYKWLDSISIR